MSGKIENLGILAGEGELPLQLVHHCLKNNIPVCVVQFKDCEYTDYPDVPILRTPIEKVGAIFKFFQSHRVSNVVMIGNLKRPDMASLRPDWQGIKTLARIAKALVKEGDNALLTSLRSDIEAQGFHVKSIDHYLTNLTVSAGCFTKHNCNMDMGKGISIALKHGAEDKGQSVLLHSDGTYSCEDVDGTTALIQKHGREGSVLIKMMKPQQDSDLDRPTVGLQTLEALRAKDCDGLIIQADAVFLVNKDDMITYANANDLFIEAVNV